MRGWSGLRSCGCLFLGMIGSVLSPFATLGATLEAPPEVDPWSATEQVARTDVSDPDNDGWLRSQGLAVDTQDRLAVARFYQLTYLASDGAASGWDGNVASCDPGDLSVDYRTATLQRVNYFRAMAGLPGNVTLAPAKNTGGQAAALMMSANGALSHSPPSSWDCYTSAGYVAAASSNLAAGTATAWDAIDLFMGDPGQSEVGHRRWILYPRYVSGGVGATFGGAWDAYALWVLGDFGTRPVDPSWVAWPPAGYVPAQVVYALWSFTMDGADFSGAAVSVTEGGGPELASALTVLSPSYGDPGISWQVPGFPMSPPPGDILYHVQVTNVIVAGVPTDFEYGVTIIDPDSGLTSVDPTPSSWGALKAAYR